MARINSFSLTLAVLAYVSPVWAQTAPSEVNLQRRALDSGRTGADRSEALYELRRENPQSSIVVAGQLLGVADPELRLAAAWICTEAGDPRGEGVLIATLGDTKTKKSFRGLAALALTRRRNATAIAPVITAANECLGEMPVTRDTRAFASHLLQALAEYQRPEYCSLALRLFEQSGRLAPVESLGLLGCKEAQPILRQICASEKNAVLVISAELALARTGDTGGSSFVEGLLRRAGAIRGEAGPLTLGKEEPGSGRLAAELLRELGEHPSDRQFLPSILGLIREAPCESCETALSALGRIGIAGYEDSLVEIAEKARAVNREKVLRVFAGTVPAARARAAAKRLGAEREMEGLLTERAAGLHKEWFRARARLFD